jgi:hypothetical protein
MAGKWDIVCKPEGKTVYKNPDGDDDEGQNMGEMLTKVINMARTSVDLLNTQFASSGDTL